jgi:DNA-binding transcriptional LysR family regulator
VARHDLRAGKLVAIRPEAWSEAETRVTLFAIHRNDATFGPAHRWLVEALATSCTRDALAAQKKRPKKPKKG